MIAIQKPVTGAEFTLDIFGTPGMRVRGNCLLLPNSEKPQEFAVLVPEFYRFDTAELSCAVQKWDDHGRLKVRLWRGETLVAAAETAAPYQWIMVWWQDGKAGSRSGPRGMRQPRPRPW